MDRGMDRYIVVVCVYDRMFIQYLKGMNSMSKEKSKFQNIKYSMILFY